MGDSSPIATDSMGPSLDVEIDPGERRLNELGYKQELKRKMTLFKCLAIAFSTMTLFTGIVPLYGSSFADAGPVGVVWGWVVVAFFTWFVGFAMAEICSSFPTTGSLYFWAAHLAGPKYGPLASWVCAWLEVIGLIAGIGTQKHPEICNLKSENSTTDEGTASFSIMDLIQIYECDLAVAHLCILTVTNRLLPILSHSDCEEGQAYAGTQTLQNIILLCTGTNKHGGYFAPRGVFLAIYIALCLTWAILNTFALNVIAILDIISIYWQVIGGTVIVILLPLVAPKTQSASYVFTHFEKTTSITGIHSSAYAVILSFLVSQYSLYGYDAAAHLTEETKNAAVNGPIAILASIGLISVFGWAFILVLTFSIQDPAYLFDAGNETGGQFVPAQILYDAFHGRYKNATGANVILCIIWASFFFGGLSITTSAARVADDASFCAPYGLQLPKMRGHQKTVNWVYALSRDGGIPGSNFWKKVHPKYGVPANAVWLCATCAVLLGLPILGINVVFTAITSICTIGWVGGYAVPIFCRMIIPSERFHPGPFHLGRFSRPVCLLAFLWICYTCSVFLLPTYYPIKADTFNYAPVALGAVLTAVMTWWVLDARKWFKGPVRNTDTPSGHEPSKILPDQVK